MHSRVLASDSAAYFAGQLTAHFGAESIAHFGAEFTAHLDAESAAHFDAEFTAHFDAEFTAHFDAEFTAHFDAEFTAHFDAEFTAQLATERGVHITRIFQLQQWIDMKKGKRIYRFDEVLLDESIALVTEKHIHLSKGVKQLGVAEKCCDSRYPSQVLHNAPEIRKSDVGLSLHV